MKFLVGSLAIAGMMRYLLIGSSYQRTIADRVEVSTPLNSWKRLVEGVHLYEEGIDPYEGDMFHESPPTLIAFRCLARTVPRRLPLIFVVCDLIAGLCLYLTAKNFAKRQKNEEEFGTAPALALAAYLFNPYSVLNCVAMTTTVINNLLVAAALLSMANGRRVPCCAAIAAAAHQSLYPALLIVPAALCVRARSRNSSALSCHLKTATVFILFWAGLIRGSAILMGGSYQFMENTYGFILNVPDLKPNIGLFWYFFTEMFEHFRPLFICAFQINATLLYVIPLTLRFKNEPLLLATTLITLTSIFKSYPSLGDVAFYLAMLPMWKHLFSYMQQKFIVGCFMLVTSALGPTVWHLWIYSRSANANFFFGVTLAFATAQIFLITDLLFAYIKREHDLKHGVSREIDGKPAKLILR